MHSDRNLFADMGINPGVCPELADALSRVGTRGDTS